MSQSTASCPNTVAGRPARLPALLAMVLLAAAGVAQAQVRQDPPTLPRWEVGGAAIAVNQQAYPGSDTQLNRVLALPYFLYRGDVLRADRDGAGLRAFRSRDMELDVGVAAAFGSRGGDIPARRGMADLGTLIEVGPRLKYALGDSLQRGWRIELPVRAVFDLSDSLAHRGLVVQPAVVWAGRGPWGWNLSTAGSVLLADRRLARNFYEVPAAAALPGRPAYAAEGGVMAWRLSAALSRELSRDWRLFTFARLDTVAGAANRDSPLVRQRTGASFGVGLTYTWLRSDAAGAD